MVILGIDSGLATCGLAAVELLPAGERVLETHVFTSEPSAKKLNVGAADDTARRGRELADAVLGMLSRHSPAGVALESPSWPRNCGASAKLGVAFGVIFGLIQARALPLVMASPQAVKKAVVGKKSASKEEIIAAIDLRFPGMPWPARVGLHEHAADAVAVVLACLNTSALQMARRFSALPAYGLAVTLAPEGKAA